MPTLTYPALSTQPFGFSMQLRANTQAFPSPLNGAVQTVELPGAMWVCEVQYDTLRKRDRLLLQAFASRLRGRAGRAFLWDMSHSTPLGVATGTPLVQGAGQTGASLITDGWTPSITGILKAGDYFGVNTQLHRLVEDANTSAGGVATLLFEAPLRASPADNAVITVNAPTFKAMLADDEQDIYMARTSLPNLFDGGMTLKFVEAFT